MSGYIDITGEGSLSFTGKRGIKENFCFHRVLNFIYFFCNFAGKCPNAMTTIATLCKQTTKHSGIIFKQLLRGFLQALGPPFPRSLPIMMGQSYPHSSQEDTVNPRSTDGKARM